jgi:hypothetical protein
MNQKNAEPLRSKPQGSASQPGSLSIGRAGSPIGWGTAPEPHGVGIPTRCGLVR